MNFKSDEKKFMIGFVEGFLVDTTVISSITDMEFCASFPFMTIEFLNVPDLEGVTEILTVFSPSGESSNCEDDIAYFMLETNFGTMLTFIP
jgi:hypothetical protein